MARKAKHALVSVGAPFPPGGSGRWQPVLERVRAALA